MKVCPNCVVEILEHPANRCLDELVEKYIMGLELWKPTHGNCCTCQRCGRSHDECICEEYSTDISAAWEVVLHLMNKGWCPNLINDDNGHWALSFEGVNNIPCTTQTSFIEHQELWCDEAPLAICRAALLTVDE